MTSSVTVEGTAEDEIPDVVQRIIDAAQQRAEDRPEVIGAFVTAALKRVPPTTLALADADAVAEQMVSAFKVLDGRRDEDVAIRIDTPDRALDGVSDPSTVIEVTLRDSPFLLATVAAELEMHGLETRRIIHPVLGLDRGADGKVKAIVPSRAATTRDAFMHFELTTVIDDDVASELREVLPRLMRDVHLATDDFGAMRERLEEQIVRLGHRGIRKFAPDIVEESVALLRWLLDDNFLLLGIREYELVIEDGVECVETVRRSGLGLLRDDSSSRFAKCVPVSELDPAMIERFRNGEELLTFSRTNTRSTVRRRARMDYVGIKQVDANGNVAGEFRIVGLFTRKGYAEPAQSIPVLRRKLDLLLEREDVVRSSHDERTLVSLYQALPKDELFQASIDDLHRTLVGLLQAEEQRQVRVIVRTEPFTRTVSVVAAIPRERYDADLRRAITDLLMRRYGAERVTVNLALGDRPEAVARFDVDFGSGDIPDISSPQLQAEIRDLARSWADDLNTALLRLHGQATADRLARSFVARLPVQYPETTPLPEAIIDVGHLDRIVRNDGDLDVRLHADRGETTVRLKAYRAGDPLELSGFLPVLESLGLRVSEEIPYHLEGEGPALVVHDYGVRPADGSTIDLANDGRRIADAVLAGWREETDVDSLNRLVLAADLGWRQVAILRAYRRYRRQVGTQYTPETVNDALVTNPEAARALIESFEARFDPARDDDTRADAVTAADAAVLASSDAIARLDHDRIVRDFLALIDASLRTNAYRDDAVVDGPLSDQVPYIAIKFDSSRVPGVPKPVPYREIFVSSVAVEGVHLRGGPIARGGLRWSDRADDVRTEVLGLMKAQVLKNAVIVPTGAKGGFVLKRRPTDQAELRAAVAENYKTFVRALLDVTDNLVAGEVVNPPLTVRRDADDPYLVVAADRGTATFSDVANGLAIDANFWLGDAFASGGSQGYDHKALGITARGAWVAVQRHFRELGIDTQSEAVRTVGVGDMSGDVFGNGMLRSRTIELVAAFDHRDIFIDPKPAAEAAYVERERIFGLERSSWQDYDRSLISAGGGVFSRSAKRIELSDEIRAVLRVDVEAMTPAELMRAVLQAPVDLLWFGGIGTYIKGTGEPDDEIGDRANDEIRLTGEEVRARVIGEGANLGVTQRGRIQYARRGGRVNLDAIDNVAGVDSSDHEVNIKILLGAAVADGRLTTGERNALLVEVTDDVVDHVLRDVDKQTLTLSQAVSRSQRTIDAHEQLMRTLEEMGELDRDVDNLPGSAETAMRAEQGAGLTRPELAVLIGHVKRVLTADIVASEIPDDPSLRALVVEYFPATLVERFDDLIDGHRLYRELVATRLANDLVDRLGITFAFRIAGETGRSRADVAGAYWTAREVADGDDLWTRVEELESLLPTERFFQVKGSVDALIRALVRSYLRSDDAPGVVIERDAPYHRILLASLDERGSEEQQRERLVRRDHLIDDLVNPDLASMLAGLQTLEFIPDVSGTVRMLGSDPDDYERGADAVADAFLRLDAALSISALENVVQRVRTADRWARAQAAGLIADLRGVRRAGVLTAIAGTDGDVVEAVEAAVVAASDACRRAREIVTEVGADPEPRLDALAVAARSLATAIRAH